ncbi:MAG: hypothetical protein AUK12_03305 [Candidatus Levybacteria bacterium CG2_30_37_29]|nr:MAG: hypothetical protein AUK12_03305 [Candidatus Levybacteria bacterium CG2_30_37_29]
MKISVIAHVNSKKPRVEPDLLGTLHVYVSEPPLENRANIAVIEALAKHFKVKKRNINFISGRKSKNKLFEIIEN